MPSLRAHVTDLTGTLAEPEKQALEQKLADWEARRGGQFAVLLVPTTQHESIDQYSQRVTDVWKIGRQGVDDGVLLLIAKNDKKLRFQVGKGLEGTQLGLVEIGALLAFHFPRSANVPTAADKSNELPDAPILL